MRIAYLEIRNLDSHERKALSYWIGGGVVIVAMIIILIRFSYKIFTFPTKMAYLRV